MFQGIDKFGRTHYNYFKRYHCFGKTAHSRLSLSQFSVADTVGEPFLFSKSGHSPIRPPESPAQKRMDGGNASSYFRRWEIMNKNKAENSLILTHNIRRSMVEFTC